MNRQLTASAIVQYEGKFLLVFHRKLNVWIYPGGHVNQTEAIDEAVVREVSEECALDIELIEPYIKHEFSSVRNIVNPFAIVEEEILKNNMIDHFHIDFVFLAKPATKSMVNTLGSENREISDLGWFEISDLNRLAIFPNVVEMITESYSIFKES